MMHCAASPCFSKNFNLSSIGSADLAKLSGANALDGTIAEAISGLRNRIHTINIDVTFVSSTDWFYTGANVTIPKNCCFSISGSLVFMNAEPSACCFNRSQDEFIWPEFGFSDRKREGLSPCCIYSGFTDNASKTLYLWGKYGGETDNKARIRGFYIEL